MRRPTLIASFAALCAPSLLMAEDLPVLRDLQISLNIMAAGGGSTADDHLLEHLQTGAHDPNRRGFTFQQAELAMAGAVDPYFRAESYLVFSPDEGVELEEAFAQTTALPAGLMIEAGYFLTEFGRSNPSHPHSSMWLDRPIVVGRLLGPEGIRGVGTRVEWRMPLPWLSSLHVGVQNADDASMAIFRGEGHAHGEHEEGEAEVIVGGRQAVEDLETTSPSDFLWLLRWSNAIDAGEWTFRAGVSWLNGPNRSGEAGDTTVLGLDVAAKWYAPGARGGAPFVAIEAEWIRRATGLAAGAFDDDGDPLTPGIALDADDISDQGAYAQVVYGWNPRWAAGMRGEYLRGTGDSLDETGAPISPDTDPEREDRVRVSPMLTWAPSHFARLRLQYDYDRFSSQEEIPSGSETAHSIWLGLEVTIGAHPAHVF